MDKLKILIIDDDKVDCMNYQRILEKTTDFSANVLEANNAKQGIEFAAKETVDCILLDYNLPDMDGIQLVKTIRKQSNESPPIIMLTGQGNEHVAVAAMKEGVNDYITKSDLNPRFLTTLIINTINKCQLEKQLALYSELEEKNKNTAEQYDLKNEFLENMSHELRTPLNIIIGLTNLLRDEEFGPINNEQKSTLNDIISNAKQLFELIRNAISITEKEAHHLNFHPEKTDLTKIVSETAEIFKPIANGKHITITYHIEKSCDVANIDPARFKQVLSNYLANAIKFTPDSGSVNINIKSEINNTFRLEVADNGIGIKPENIKKLFATFHQLDSSTTKKYGGSGLGLALVKRIVEAQGGEVGVKSTLGEGSVFYATFKK